MRFSELSPQKLDGDSKRLAGDDEVENRTKSGVSTDGLQSHPRNHADDSPGCHGGCVTADAEFNNTGLERSAKLAKDLEWFKEQGHNIPEPSSTGVTYVQYLKDLSEKDQQAFLCHFYNIYFAHTAGGRMIGRKERLGTNPVSSTEMKTTETESAVAEKIIDNKELEFYKWDGELSLLLQNVREKLNEVAEGWTREEKNHCLEETEKSFKYTGEFLRLILS